MLHADFGVGRSTKGGWDQAFGGRPPLCFAGKFWAFARRWSITLPAGGALHQDILETANWGGILASLHFTSPFSVASKR